jgi:hypothetical protein
MLVLLSRDLFFASKVTGTAQRLGLSAVTVPTVAALRERLSAGDVTGVMLDLGCGILAADVAGACPLPRPKLLAFGAHVDVAALESAVQSGFDDVLPRSKFSAQLPELLRGMAGTFGA